MLHPAVLLVMWAGFAFILQWTTASSALLISAVCLFCSLFLARQRTLRLLRRSRWLLLSLAILFLFFTPGEYLPGMAGNIGITWEGVRNAEVHVGRLMALLASLALLHERIGTPGVLAGLYSLLGASRAREKTVVRLMLVLDVVEQRESMDWRRWLTEASIPEGGHSMHLHVPSMRALDRWLIGGLLLSILLLGAVR